MSIDLDFRPVHYADFDNPVALALNGIKGQMRREMVRDMLSAEGEQRAVYDQLLGPIAEDILADRAPEAFVRTMNLSRGPSWMGGEYLPDLEDNEVEIARVILDSTTMDVFSVRALHTPQGYRYSMVDEYAGEFWVTPESSAAPLTLSELVELIDGAGGPVEVVESFVATWWWQLWENGRDLERCTEFAWVESEQYPQLGAYYEERARQWRVARAAEAQQAAGEG